MLRSASSLKRRQVLTVACGLATGLGITSLAHATALTGSGPSLLGPPSTAVATIAVSNPTLTGPNTGPFTGTWVGSSPAAPAAWGGVYSATGPYTGGGGPNGTTVIRFNTMTTGGLPAGSYIYLGDLDNGSGTETFTAQAFNAAHVPLTTAWLDTAISIYGSGVGPGGLPAVTDTPAWSYNASTATYTFDGSGVPGNPAVAVLLPTNQGIAEMDVFRDTSSASYAIQAPAAPVPEPATMGLLMLTGVAVVGRRRFRRM